MKVEAIKFMLYASEMKRAVGFYRDVFGLDVTIESEHWSELQRGDATVALHGGRGNTELRTTGLSFQVDDIAAACAAVSEAGGAIRSGPTAREGEPIKLADATDPEGNGFMITEYVG